MLLLIKTKIQKNNENYINN